MDVSHGLFNTLRPRQNGCHFTDDNFKSIFFNENEWILVMISLKFVPNGSMNNISSLVQIMAWRRPGDKPLSKPMMVRLLMHTCVTRLQWVKAWCVYVHVMKLIFPHCKWHNPNKLLIWKKHLYLLWIQHLMFKFISVMYIIEKYGQLDCITMKINCLCHILSYLMKQNFNYTIDLCDILVAISRQAITWANVDRSPSQ